MHKEQVEIGATYLARIANDIAYDRQFRNVRIDGPHYDTDGHQWGWDATILETGESHHFEGAGRLQFRVDGLDVPEAKSASMASHLHNELRGEHPPKVIEKVVDGVTEDANLDLHLPCTCPSSCSSSCKGACGCRACRDSYADFLSCE